MPKYVVQEIDNNTDEVIENLEEFDNLGDAEIFVRDCQEGNSEGAEVLKLSNLFDYEDDYGNESENTRYEIDEIDN